MHPGVHRAPGMLPGAPSVPHVSGVRRNGLLPRDIQKAIAAVGGCSTARGSEQIWRTCPTSSGCPQVTSRQPTRGNPLVGPEVDLPGVGPQGYREQSGPSAAPPVPDLGIWDRGLQAGGVMKLQSAARAASSRILGNPANTYCCARRIWPGKTEKTVIGGLGTASSWPLGWPTQCSPA